MEGEFLKRIEELGSRLWEQRRRDLPRELAEQGERTLLGCRGEEAAVLRWELATLPLWDLGEYGPELFLNEARQALAAREEFPWGRGLPDALFLREVACPRVNNEGLAPCRELFRGELAPRVRGALPGGGHFGGEPLVRREGHLPGQRRQDRLGPGGGPPGLWPLRGGIPVFGERPAQRGHSRQASVRPLVVPLRRQPRLGGGLGWKHLAVPGGLRARACAGPGVVYRGGGQGHAAPRQELLPRGPGGGGLPLPGGGPLGPGPAGGRGVREPDPPVRGHGALACHGDR